MSHFFHVEDLKPGDLVGIYGATNYDPNLSKAEVVRITKTTVTVRRANHSSAPNPFTELTFMKSTLKQRGSDETTSWRVPSLISFDRYQELVAFKRQKRADLEKAGFRERMAEKLKNASRNDAAFRELLAELNSREYV